MSMSDMRPPLPRLRLLTIAPPCLTGASGSSLPTGQRQSFLECFECKDRDYFGMDGVCPRCRDSLLDGNPFKCESDGKNSRVSHIILRSIVGKSGSSNTANDADNANDLKANGNTTCKKKSCGDEEGIFHDRAPDGTLVVDNKRAKIN